MNGISALLFSAALLAATFAARGEPIERSIRVGADERRYEVDLPRGAPRDRPLPVVVVFHGGGGSAAGTRKQTRMSELGNAEGFVTVYPHGSGPFGSRLLTWNAITCCSRAMQQHGCGKAS